MVSSYFPVPTSANGEGIAPLGRPIPNYQIYVLDTDLNPVPIGIKGELYIGSVAWHVGI